MARIIGLAMKGEVEFEIVSKSLVGFKRGLHNDYHLSNAFHAALDDWRDGMGLKLDRDHDDLRYPSRCRQPNTNSGAARLRLPGASGWAKAAKSWTSRRPSTRH